MPSMLTGTVLTGILLLTQTIRGNDTDTKYGMVLGLISSLSPSHTTKEFPRPAPCETVNPTVVSYIDCKLLKDGVYQDPNTRNCSEYFRCEKQQRINCSCGPDLVFDAQSQTCVRGQQQAPCPRLSDFGLCFSRADGFYHVPNTDCRKYYECRGGRGSDHECDRGLAFDVEKLLCVDEGEFKCRGEAPLADAPTMPECAGKPDGKYGARDSHNKRFYACFGGLKISEGACLEGQRFSEELQRCAAAGVGGWSDDDDGPRASPLFSSIDCLGLDDGYYPNVQHACTRFFYCRNKKKMLEMACPAGLQFDNQTKKCLDSSEVTCPGSTEPLEESIGIEECLNRTDGYYPLESSQCRQFFYCKNHQKTSVLYCPAGDAFDVSAQRCESESVVFCGGRLLRDMGDGEEDEDCAGKSDGYYPDYAIDCRGFVYCKNGRKRIELMCQHNNAFDPTNKTCQPFSTVACHEEFSVSVLCSGKRDGYYPDIAKSCKSFYSCRGGRVVNQLTCRAGHAFDDDAKECFPQSMVTCMTSQRPLAAIPPGTEPGETVCQNQTDGYYPDYGAQCARYFHCRKGRKAIEYVCTAGQLFDPVTLRCVNERYVVCADPASRYRMDSCAFKDDGYYPTYAQNCRTFYYCRNRMKIVDLTCRSRHLFDTEKGSCQDETVAVCATDILRNSSVECRGRSDGYYGDYDGGNCSNYYHCYKGAKDGDFACGNGTCFDENDNVCVAPPIAGSFNCSRLPNGYYVDYLSSCRKFHICQNGKLETQKCPGNMIFDLSDLSCESRKTLQCKASRDFPCGGLADGAHEDRRGNDQLFHVCRGGRHVESGSCPHYYAFDKRSTACVSESAVLTAETAQPLAGDDPGAGFVPDCKGRGDGSYPDLSLGCAHFYECRSGQPRATGRCPPGHLFQSWKQECRPRQEVSCEERAPPSGTTSFHFQFHNGCSNVTLCFENKHSFARYCRHPEAAPPGGLSRIYCKIGSIAEKLPDDKYGDGRARSESPPDPLATFDCIGKEDGYYTDPTSKCRKWHVCDGGRGYTYECDSGKAFDILHKHCDLSESVSCAAQSWVYRNYSSARSLPTSFRSQTQEFRKQTSAVADHQECSRKSDGIYIDLTGVSFPSNTCFNVYLCINEQVYSISCPFEKPRAGDKEVMCQAKDDVRCMKGAADDQPAAKSSMESDSASAKDHEDDDVVEAQPTSLVSRRLLTPASDAAVSSGETDVAAFNCSGKLDGFYPDHRQQCHVFYRCVHGKKFSHYCQPGQLFSSQLQGCDLQENVACEEQTFVAPKPNQ